MVACATTTPRCAYGAAALLALTAVAAHHADAEQRVRSARLPSLRRPRLAVVEAYEPAEGGRLQALGAGREVSGCGAFGQKADHW